MKNLAIILFSFLLGSSYATDDVTKSKQIRVQYEQKTKDGTENIYCLYSNDLCLHNYKLSKTTSTSTLVDFKRETITRTFTGLKNEPSQKTISFKEYEKQQSNSSQTNIYSYFNKEDLEPKDYIKSDETKDICGISCNKMILRFENTDVIVWYFTPKNIEETRINKYSTNYDVPGIILEVLSGDKTILKASSVDTTFKI